MLLLFETASGYALFKVIKEKKLSKCEDVFQEFNDVDKLSQLLSLKRFESFNDTDDAVKAVTTLLSGKLSKKLKKLISEEVEEDSLAVADSKLATLIKDKMEISCMTSPNVQKLMTCIRSKMDVLIPDLNEIDNEAMQLALAHGMSRFKLKFSADKVDMMIIHAVSLLDDLDKELNNYIMRCKEWYGWHFPELAKIVPDNEQYVKTILAIGMKENAAKVDMSAFLEEKVETQVKELAEVSMGTEITDEDMLNIEHLCKNVLDLYEYRTQLFEYIKNRMMAIAPNLAILVGELVGARLISKAGSLINLAKHPASTVQILGAEKALFRALKTRHDTPKYGLIYHAQLIGLSNQKIKGKMSRALAAKAALSCRVDALGEGSSNELGLAHKAKLEAKLKFLEEGGLRRISKSAKKSYEQPKFEHKSKILKYKDTADFVNVKKEEEPEETAQIAEEQEVSPAPKSGKKDKKRKLQQVKQEEEEEEEPEEELDESPAKKVSSAKKDKKRKLQQVKQEEEEEPEEESDESPAKKVVSVKKEKKRKHQEVEEEQEQAEDVEQETTTPKKKKNKKKKQQQAEEEDDE